jgi:predicted nuclease with TOPRIM domain
MRRKGDVMMDKLEKAAYRFMNQPRSEKEKLEMIRQCDIIQAIEDGFNDHKVNRDEILKDVNWLIEQAEKLEKELSIFNIQVMKEKIEKIENENESLTERFHKQAEYIINLEARLRKRRK